MDPRTFQDQSMTIQRDIGFCKSSDGVELAMGLYGRGPPLVKAATWLTHIELDQTSPFDRQLIDAFAPDTPSGPAEESKR
jgi:hypothetical protein